MAENLVEYIYLVRWQAVLIPGTLKAIYGSSFHTESFGAKCIPQRLKKIF